MKKRLRKSGAAASKPDLAARRVPALVTYLHPFRLVQAKDATPWVVTLDEINNGSWDYVALHELIGGLDIGLASPYHLVVARDGALALPPIPELREHQAAVEFFNRCLASLLIGGVYCEAITLDNLDFGSILDWKYLRISSRAGGASNRFHDLIRQNACSSLEAISLHKPRIIEITVLEEAMRSGRAVLNEIPSVSGEFLLKGVTGIARRDWGGALANLWIVVEQLTSHLWKQHVLNASGQMKIEGRKEQLEDSRTWTTSNRLELLYQKNILNAESLGYLSAARKSRNSLVHRGLHPNEKAALASYQGVLRLLAICLPGRQLGLASIDLANHSISDPFNPAPLTGEPEFWRHIPKLPGEEDLERAEAEFYKRR